jgi:hypothetical protein
MFLYYLSEKSKPFPIQTIIVISQRHAFPAPHILNTPYKDTCTKDARALLFSAMSHVVWLPQTPNDASKALCHDLNGIHVAIMNLMLHSTHLARAKSLLQVGSNEVSVSEILGIAQEAQRSLKGLILHVDLELQELARERAQKLL